MKKIKLYGTLSETSSTILGELIVNSNLTSIDIHGCGVYQSMWNIINNPIYKDSYELYQLVKLSLPIINDWLTVRDMLNNNIRINNLVLQHHELNTYNSTLFAEGLLNNKVINNMTFNSLEITPDNPTNYDLIFFNIINRQTKMEYLYFDMFYFYPANEIKYMLDNNWLKVLYINDDYEQYFSHDHFDARPLWSEEIVELISYLFNNTSLYLFNNTSLTKFYFNAGNIQLFSQADIKQISNILDNNFTLLECDISDEKHLYIPAVDRNNINKFRKNVKLEELMYNAVDNAVCGPIKCKDFIAHYIISKYEK